jgi:predicted transposase/invertase (TIGR01784 family)
MLGMAQDSDDLHQAHDKLFLAGFGDPANTASFLKEHLPAEVSAAIDWEALKPEPGSFVDSHYDRSHTDLLFSSRISGRPILVYLLFEHQSTEDRFMALRLLRYMLRIWENHLSRHPRDRLPLILPAVLRNHKVSVTNGAKLRGVWDEKLFFSLVNDKYIP